jgi:hypothetical protein
VKLTSNGSLIVNSPTTCFFCLLVFFLIFHSQTGFTQSRAGVGVRFGLNKPLAAAYKLGESVAFQINIPINRKWGVDPSIGYDVINVEKQIVRPINASYDYIKPQSLKLFRIDLAARYYITPDLFTRVGPFFFVSGGNEDMAGIGIGGTAAIGYQLMLDTCNKLEFTFNTDILEAQSGRGKKPIVGLKIAFAFNLSHKQP